MHYVFEKFAWLSRGELALQVVGLEHERGQQGTRKQIQRMAIAKHSKNIPCT